VGLRSGGSSCQSSFWMSATTVICKASAGRANGHRILITAGISAASASKCFSFDRPVVSLMEWGSSMGGPLDGNNTLTVNGANFGTHSASIYVKVGYTYSANVQWTSDSSLQSLVPKAASENNVDDIMCSTSVFADIAIMQKDCKDDVSFNVGYGGCSTYAASNQNAGQCQAHGACNACGCSCANACGGNIYGFTCRAAHSVLIGKSGEGFSADWKDGIAFSSEADKTYFYECPANYVQFFKNCLACPANSNSPAGSLGLTSCNCNAGSTGPNGGPCAACVAGQYKAVKGLAACTDCPANSSAPVGSTSLTACTCNAGSTGPDGGTCTACEAGKYKTLTGTATCSDCAAGTYSTAVGASASSTCSTCPSNSNSSAGSAAFTSCACSAGYYQRPDPIASILNLYPAYLAASAESWDASERRFLDLSGSGRVGTLQAGTVNVGSVTGHGANLSRSVPYALLTYAHVCSRMLTYAHVCSRMLTRKRRKRKQACALCGGDDRHSDFMGRRVITPEIHDLQRYKVFWGGQEKNSSV
jgi:hypothetical protein